MSKKSQNPTRTRAPAVARRLPLALLLALPLPAAADTPPANAGATTEPVPTPPPAPIVHMIPWANDYSYLADPAMRSGAGWERLAYIPLGDDPGTFLTIGGELRYYAQYWEHVTLGIVPNDRNDSIQQRVRLHGDLHVGRNFRAFLELGDNWEFGAEFPTPSNFDAVDIQQAFVDVSFQVGEGSRLTLRPGRFVMPLGNGIMVGTRDGTAVRYTYDGLRAMLSTGGGARIDVFATRPMRVERGSFDNRPDNGRDFSGVYFSRPTGPGSGWDLYHYNVGHEHVSFPGGSGPQRRRSFGARVFGRPGAWDYDLEAVVQTGSFADQDIRAWGIISNGGYTFGDLRFSPRLGVRFNAFSGDDDPGRGRLGTFEAPFPRTALHTDAGVFVFMNLVNLAPSVAFQFSEGVRASAGVNGMWRESTADDIYYGGTGRSLTAVPTRDRHVATSLDLQADWQVNRHLNFHLYGSHIRAGSALTAAGGETTNYVGFWGQFRF